MDRTRVGESTLAGFRRVLRHDRNSVGGHCRRRLLLATVASGVLISNAGHAGPPSPTQLPTGGTVVSGAATLNSSGSTLTVNQSSGRAAINWSSFSVGQAATVTFAQPDARSVTLNRVVGNEGSVIEGALHANGQVFLVNPNGVLFGKNARVDVGGLAASTLNMSNADFMAGKSTFTAGVADGAVANKGKLTAAEGGYIALIGNKVSNTGVITAKLGTVALAAGNKVTLNFNGNSLVDVTIDQAAFNALVANGGIMLADGGTAIMTAKTADTLLNTVVNNTGVVQSRTIQNKSGHIYLLGEGGTLEVGGTLDASAPSGGNGGAIETSSDTVKVAATAKITTAAAHGHTGTWLIDPTDFTIASSGGDMTGATLTSELGSSNVSIQSSAGGASGTGSINVNDVVSWSSHTLTLTAANNININAAMTASGAASLNLEPATANGSASAVTTGMVNVGMSGASFTGAVNFSGTGTLTISNHVYTVINSLGTASSSGDGTLQGMAGNLSGYYALGSNIDASATTSWNAGGGFTPIGISSSFGGVFDGLGHTITNPKFNTDGTSNSGLFHNVTPTVAGSNGIVRNVGVVNFSNNSSCDQYCSGLVDYITGSGIIANVFVTGNVTYTASTVSYVGFVTTYIPNGAIVENVYGSGSLTATQYLEYGGLIGYTDVGSTVTHATSAVSISAGGPSNYCIGGLVGYAGGNVDHSTSSGLLTVGGASASYIGGLIGWADGTISTSSSSVSIVANGSGPSYIGGLAGYASSPVSNSSATGSISVGNDASSVGGLLGDAETSVSSSFATGSITPTGTAHWVGGLIGQFFGGTLTASYATGSISTTTDINTIGGLIGDLASGTVTQSYATGNVTATGSGSNALGGLVGSVEFGGIINNSYSSGNVTAGTNASHIGGLIGITDGAAISYSYAVGAVSAGSGSSAFGGLVGADGEDTSSFTHNFWNTTTSGQSTSAAGIGMTTAQMEQQANFTSATSANGNSNPGWNTSDTWVIYSGNAYPLLRVFMTPLTISINGSKTYDGTVAGSVVAYSTTPNTNELFGTLTLSGAGSNVGTYTITPSGLYSNQQGYIITFTGGSITVNPATLTATATGGTEVYNGSVTVPVTLSVTPIGSDQVTVSDSSATMANKDVGTDKTVTVTGLTLSGAAAGNYVLASTSTTTTETVTAATLTINGTTIVTKAYDGTTTADVSLGSLSGLINGDVVDVRASGSYNSAAAGTNKQVNVTYSLSGADSGDYVILPTTETLTGTITAVTTPTPIPTPTPTPTPTTPTTIITPTVSLNEVIAVANQSVTHVFLPFANVITNLPPLPATLPTLANAAGSPLLVFATPSDAGATEIDLPQLRQSMGVNDSDPVVVPLARSKWVSLLNGGVKLPDGVDQQFFLNPAH